MRPTRVLFVLLALAATVLSALLALRARTGGASTSERSSGLVVENERPQQPAESTSAPALSDPGRVEPESSQVLTGSVRSSAGQVIRAATVTLTMPTLADAECEPAWGDSDWGPLARRVDSTATGADGEFSFQVPREAPLGVLLWASHPDFLAASRLLGSERRTWPWRIEIVLEPARGMTVVVVDGTGKPVPAATVVQSGLAEQAEDNTATDLGPGRAKRLFQQTYSTAVDGTVLVGRVPGKQVLVASRGGEATEPWLGTWQERVTLTLRPTFVLDGRISLPDSLGESQREHRILVAAQSRNLWRDLASIRGVEEGHWGPLTIPLVEADRYRVRLEGAPLIPTEVFFAPPAPGTRVTEDLHPEVGVELWFHVMDEQRNHLPAGRVKVLWPDVGRPDHWNFAEASRTAMNQIGIQTLPRGSFKCEAWAPGYVPLMYGPFDTSIGENAAIEMVLQKAGTLRGQVLRNGEPVEDFEVLVWQPAFDNTTRSTAFFDRPDGRFELDNVPMGEFWVTANSPTTPACEPVAISSKPGQAAEVILELLDGLRGRGRIVDLATGEPLQNAAVQLFVKGDVVPVARWGLPVPVQADGTFDLPGYLPGENFIRAMADGYSSLVVTREAGAGSFLDWGEIALAPLQDLRVVLDPAERALGASVQASGAASLPARQASAEGSVVFPGVSAGTYALEITEVDGTLTLVELALVLGEPWVVRRRIAGDNRLSVRVVSDGREAMSLVSTIHAAYVVNGVRTVRTKLPRSGGSVEFEGVEASVVAVHVIGKRGEEATAVGTFVGGRLELEVPLTSDRFLLRVVDVDDNPISDVRVTITDPRAPGLCLFGGTDASGECALRGVPRPDFVVGLQHGTHGVQLGIPIGAGSGSAEIVLDGRARIELALRDGEIPLAGVRLTLLDHTGAAVQSGYSSDVEGRLAIPGLGEGRYFLRASRPDCWTTDFEARASQDERVQVLQLRRLGNLELQVLTPYGQPAPGLALRLTSAEFGSEVADWIRDERVRSPGLMTDAGGLVRVARLPRGPYRWRVDGLEDGPLQGSVDVQPAGTTSVQITIP